MKRLAVCLVLLFVSSAVFGQAMPANAKRCAVPAVDKALRQIAEDWKTAYNEGDPDKVARLYAEDATYLTQHFVTGVVHGRPAIRAYVKNGTDAKYKVDSIEVLATDCSGDFGYAITRYRSTNGEQKAMGVNLVVMRKLDGKWLIVAHEAAVPDPANAVQNLKIASDE